jgi:ferric-dicitrate binding protein FerR (iron transport regulator)
MNDTPTQTAEVDPELSAYRKARRTKWLKRLAIALAIAGVVWLHGICSSLAITSAPTTPM